MLVALLAAILFATGFRITAEQLRRVDWRKLISFYLCRFMVLPALLYVLVAPLWPQLAPGVLLLALMPAGVTSPALTLLYAGNTAFALGLVTLSSLLTPMVVPVLFELLVGEDTVVDAGSLLFTLLIVLGVPAILHLFLLPVHKYRDKIGQKSIHLIIPLIGCMAMLAVARNRSFLFSHLDLALPMLAIAVVLYTLFYFGGLWFGGQKDWSQSIAQSFASGYVNNTLGVVLAVLHFDDLVVTLLVCSLFAGVAVVIPWTVWLDRSERNRNHTKTQNRRG